MPIDKGGRHMLIPKQVPYKVPSDPTVGSSAQNIYFCEPSTFSSECILTLRGTRNAKNQLYILDHGENYYIFSISGKVVNISLHPDVPIFLNGKNVHKTDIKTLDKGDKVSFLKTASDKPLYAEIHLRCPIVKNE